MHMNVHNCADIVEFKPKWLYMYIRSVISGRILHSRNQNVASVE